MIITTIEYPWWRVRVLISDYTESNYTNVLRKIQFSARVCTLSWTTIVRVSQAQTWPNVAENDQPIQPQYVESALLVNKWMNFDQKYRNNIGKALLVHWKQHLLLASVGTILVAAFLYVVYFLIEGSTFICWGTVIVTANKNPRIGLFDKLFKFQYLKAMVCFKFIVKKY